MHYYFFICLFIGAVLGAAVPIPDNDPFYKPPAGFESAAPGTVFSNRPVSSGLSGVTAVQVLYRTTLINGSATATVATILTGPQSTGTKLVAYAGPEDSVNTTCADSYLYYTGTTSSSSTLGPDTAAILATGATVVVPDYEGPNSAFSVGRQEGMGLLDALRAALNYAPAGLSKTAALGGYGYSGGAIATGWAASLQPTYAPELNVKGWAFGGTPANVTSTLQNVEGTIFAGYAISGLAGQMAGYTAAQERFTQISTAAGAAAIAKARTQCSGSDLTSFLLANFETTKYQTLGNRLLYDPAVVSVLLNGTMGLNKAETPTAPIYMFHGKYDEVIPYASAQAAANAWCANGASVEFVTETGGTGHLGTALALGGTAIAWLDLRLGGTPPAAGCAHVSVFKLGIPLKRAGSATAIEIFGIGDVNIVADMERLHAAGKPVPGLFSYAKWVL
ncbi:hypothetical protein HWV62_4339 [Athelia sp. TMB]|nr:hypothetical protein HWV62_4339 [Athelia sp. TMB]